jgi:hypothetical protein
MNLFELRLVCGFALRLCLAALHCGFALRLCLPPPPPSQQAVDKSCKLMKRTTHDEVKHEKKTEKWLVKDFDPAEAKPSSDKFLVPVRNTFVKAGCAVDAVQRARRVSSTGRVSSPP